jgi:hypothetical protein
MGERLMPGVIQFPDHHIYPGRVFGKLYPKFSKKMLHFSDYATPALPMPPARVDWTRGFNINWGVMLNDSLGDCVEAAKGHALQTLTMDNGRMSTVPDSVILANYEANGGYVPGDPSTDNGENETDSLTAWQRGSVGSFKLDAYAGIRINQFSHVQQAIWLMGGVFSGFQVPQSAMDQNAAGQIWDVVPNDGGIVGGHAVWVPAYDAKLNILTCITWGMRQMMTWAFWMKYFDEGYALKVPVWENARGVAPSGFLPSQWVADVPQLQLAA